MKAAVTGATGFLGSNLVARLVADGWTVAGLAHTEEGVSDLPDGVSVEIGDINERDKLDRIVAGADLVIHTVSNFRTASGPAESYHRINVQGTQSILDAAEAAGVKRFVHCSTIGVHGSVSETPSTETSPFAPGDLYQETKLEAEQLVRSRVGKSPMEIVVVRPCSMYGPGDLRMLKMFRMLAKKRFFKVGPCRENFHAIYIDDIVEGFMRAARTEGIDGEVFLVGGPEYVPLDAYIDLAAESVGAPPPFLRFPYPLFHGAAWLCEKLFVPLGIEPPLHVRRVRFFKNNRAFSDAKARERLGHAPQTDLATGMQRTVAWYREQGLLPAAPKSTGT